MEVTRESRSGEIRASIIDTMKQWGEAMTSSELASLLNVEDINPRLSELVSCGLVVKTPLGKGHRNACSFSLADESSPG